MAYAVPAGVCLFYGRHLLFCFGCLRMARNELNLDVGIDIVHSLVVVNEWICVTSWAERDCFCRMLINTTLPCSSLEETLLLISIEALAVLCTSRCMARHGMTPSLEDVVAVDLDISMRPRDSRAVDC